MIYCANCGTPLPDEATFCSRCGTRTGTAGPGTETSKADTVSNSGSATTTEIFSEVQSQRRGIFENPNWLNVKKYLVYFMAACFLWTLFNLINVKFDSTDRRDEETKARSGIAGYNLLFGSLPNIYITEEGETKNITAEARELKGSEKRLARVPMILRIAYWVFVIGFVLYAISVFDNGPNKQWMYSVGMVTAFIGLLSVYLVYNDIETKIKTAIDMVGFLWMRGGEIKFNLGFTLGFWGLFLSFLALMFEYVVTSIGSFRIKMNPVQQNPAV
ncbi:MAG TPA: zinc ribbon domain-containing protein [Chitinophagaceae bacterium]|jgi:hypothetical protein|nr:zinc ribbon domain-containing protein [Chitinophagaceae bacterium]